MSKTTGAHTHNVPPPVNHNHHTHHYPVDVYSLNHIHHNRYDSHIDLPCHTCAEDLKIKKSSSESSEGTIAEPTWVPPAVASQHPPPRDMTESELGSYVPVWIPDPESTAERDTRPRTLVLCFDGTGDQFDDDNSNVVQFLACLKKNDKDRQLVYYQTGIGTTTTSNFITPVMTQISKTLDSMLAWNLSSHVQDGYQFLVQNYKAGDRISIFGFSRGAYTARALAGMIQRVGLLPADNTQQIPFAWSMYVREDENAEKDSAEYKRTFSTHVVIDFVGVWDTVASVGLTGKELPFVRNNTAIRIFRHALALDEHRAKFIPNFYHAVRASDIPESVTESQNNTSLIDFGTPSSIAGKDLGDKPNQYPRKDRNTPTDACEVWFAGCHCDVGGGSVKNRTAHSLARIPLRWMIRECFRMKTGIIFDARLLHEEIGLDYRTVYPRVLERPSRVSRGTRNATIQKTDPQGWGIVTFAGFLIALISIPIRVLLAVVFWPLRYIWLFLKYTPWGKWVREHPVTWIHEHPVKWVHENLRIGWITTKIHGTGAWITSRLFPKANTPVEPCTMICKDEEEHEYWDALSPIYDQLQIRWFWKILELFPMRFVEQREKRTDFYVAPNFGQGRKIYGNALYKNVAKPAIANGANAKRFESVKAMEEGEFVRTYSKTGGLKIHRSVLTRIESDANYKPLAWWDRKEKEDTGKKGEVGPDRWDIEDPDPVKYWEWVE